MWTDKTTCTSKGKEETISKKVGNVEIGVGGETDHRCCSGERALVAVKLGGREERRRDIHTGKCTRRALP